ncbi:MAG: hypothetical protein U9R47_11290, partial [Actinomycetota bacterium]|nr:hypothetical protein [Actinomycetota bacterium]
WRDEARTGNELLIADLVPSRFYRKSPSGLYSTPRVSWLAVVGTPGEARDIWWEATRSTYQDAELIVVGPDDAIRPVALLHDNPGINAFEIHDLDRALETARGEFIAIVDGRMTPHRRVVEHAVTRFDAEPRSGVVRGAYDVTDLGLFGSLDDLRAADRDVGRLGLPLFAVVRRRELMKDLRSGALDWNAVLGRSKTELLLNDTVVGSQSDLNIEVAPGGPGLADMKSARSEEIARTLVRRVRGKKSERR